MSYTLVLCEKPTAAKAVAEALADDKPKKMGEENSKAVWYEFDRDGGKFVVVPAVGHLFTLKQTDKGWAYPAFNVAWVPSYKANKFAAFSEPYFRNIESLAKDAKDVIVATDYDDEGEVIAYNILQYLLGRKDAARMRFSTMTKEELIGSYEHAAKHLNKNLIEAGLCRHYLDYYWGISLTRALTNSIKAANKRFRILSTGRVQGPTLHMLSKHEQKIKAFKPKPFWEIELGMEMGRQALKATYSKDKLWDKGEADRVLAKSKGTAVVKSVKKKVASQKPPKPYNTTSLLADIYRYFGYSPQQGMAVAEALYQAAMISYPRTSSEKLPADINYKKIISSLGKQKSYGKDARLLLQQKDLKPEEGARTDQAHPAVYPTGEFKRVGEKHQKVYDLIVRRFLAGFGAPAKRESQRIELDVNGEVFFVHGTKTIEEGWTALYGRYAKREEILLPSINKGDKFAIKSANQISKKTQPPARFSQGSVLKEMEAKSLGTKATRAQILQILYNRGYLIGKSIEVTELGLQLSNILEKSVPDVVSEKLTRRFEEMADSIERGEAKREDVMSEARDSLTSICNAFRKKEARIGEELTKAVIATQDKQSILGTCTKCGGTLKVFKMWRTGKRFVGCTGYKKGCRVGFPLPREGIIISTEKYCDYCKTPIVQVQMQGRRPFRMCLDINCETKKDWLDKKKLSQAKAESIASKKAAELLTCECGKSFKSKRALTLHRKKHAVQ